MAVDANVERFSGFAELYDQYRPQTPVALIDILVQLAPVTRPRLVVDLGSGTGLSTSVWSDRADAIIGVEPNANMRAQAERRATMQATANVRYVAGDSTATDLPDACADILTCSQSLHWMEPEPTFAEIARVLRPGGVFAAYDCDWSPTLNWRAEAAFVRFMNAAIAIGTDRGWYDGVIKWPKEEHLARMQASGRFRYTKELLVHQREMGNAGRLVGLALSQGSVATLFKRGMSEAELGVDEFRFECEQAIGNEPIPWYFHYRVRIGIV